MSWLCNCGITNAGSNDICAGIRHYTTTKHYQVSPTTYGSDLYWLSASVSEGRLKELMTENEDKFANFFNHEMVLFSSLSEIEQIEHIQQLEEIAFETKARLTAAKTAKRDKEGKKFAGGDWTITPVQPDATVTDTINKVKLRQSRMTKLDKQSAKLKALGFSDAEVNAMTAGLRTAASKDSKEEQDKSIKRSINNQIAPIVPDIPSEPPKPLILGSLNFKKG